MNLWDDHGLYTLLVMQSKLRKHSTTETTVLATRLLKNQDEIGALLNSQNLAMLLREHITIAATILDSVVQGDMNQVQQLYVDWKSNAVSVGSMLYKIQQINAGKFNLPETMWQKHMLDHLALLFDVVVSYSSNQFDKMVVGIDKYMTQIREMGRMIALLV